MQPAVFNAMINLAGRHTKERRGFLEWEHLNCGALMIARLFSILDLHRF
jgi:hypothetical protein